MNAKVFKEGTVIILSMEEVSHLQPYLHYSQWLTTKLIGVHVDYGRVYQQLNLTLTGVEGKKGSSTAVRQRSMWKNGMVTKLFGSSIGIGISYKMFSPFRHLTEQDWGLLDSRLPTRGQTPTGKQLTIQLSQVFIKPEGTEVNFGGWDNIIWSDIFPTIFTPVPNLDGWKKKVQELVGQIQGPRTLSPGVIRKILAVEV